MDLKEELLKYLREKRLMMLATSAENNPWICTVYYTIDDQFNIYFVSNPNTKHVANLQSNSKVAIAVADINQPFDSEKIGVQMEGVVEKLDQGDEHAKALELWITSAGGFKDEKIFNMAKTGAMSGAVFKVKIIRAKYFNEKLFGKFTVKEITF